MTYKYFIDLEWIPLNSCDLKRTRTNVSLSQIRRPEIVSIIRDKVFEVSDPFLFYTTESCKYEYIVYEFDNVRVVKYRKAGSNDAFKMCIKTKELNIKFLELLAISKEKTSISDVRKYNSNIFSDIEKPMFIRFDYNYIADIIGVAGKIYLSLGLTDNFILIGKSTINFRAKVQVNFVDLLTSRCMIQLVIFDVYQYGDILLRDPWEDRSKYVDLILNQFNSSDPNLIIKVRSFEFSDPKERSIVIDNDSYQYMEKNPETSVTCQAQTLKSQLQFSDGVFDIDEKTFRQSLTIKDGEIIKYCPATKTITEYHACDAMILDRIGTFKFFQWNEIHDQKSFHTKRTLIKTYATGKILIVSENMPNIFDLEYDSCPRLIKDQPIIEQYHTIIVDSNIKWQSEIESMGKKIILFNPDQTWEFKDAGEKTFVFLVGTIGSGKSALIRKVRTLFNMSGGLFIAQIDKLVENDVQFIVSPTLETYWKLRKEIYNAHMDQLIGQSIMQSNSIILETTNVNDDYVKWLKSYGYKVAVVIVNESYEKTCENIRIRNQTKLRKTHLSQEDYDLFEHNISNYVKSADYVKYIKPEYS